MSRTSRCAAMMNFVLNLEEDHGWPFPHLQASPQATSFSRMTSLGRRSTAPGTPTSRAMPPKVRPGIATERESGGGNGYDVEYDMPSQVSVNNGTLDITATQKSVVGDVKGSPVTFPVTSGAVSSYGNFEFTGGYLQISMKAPSGDGAWPGLWLLPGKGAGNSGDNFEIDMQEGGYTGTGPANQAFAAHLHTSSGTFGKQVDSGIDLTAGFNTYGIDWVPGKSITWYLNGKEMAQVTSAQMPIPTEPMELIMDSQVANSNTAGWHTVFTVRLRRRRRC